MKLTHEQRIDSLKRYIWENCDQPLDRAVLAQLSGYSVVHLHRIFTAVEGESVSVYIRRTRMRQAARRLLSEETDITIIALDVGYETHAAFSKAFKQFYEVTPTEFRQMSCTRAFNLLSRRFKQPLKEIKMESVEIVTLTDKRVLYARATEFMTGPAFKTANIAARDKLMNYLGKHNLFPHLRHIIAIYPDPAEVGQEVRFDLGAILADGVEPELEDGLAYQTIPGGEWAMFLHVGPYDTLWQTWNAAYRDWLPSSGYVLRNAIPFEDYIDNPAEVEPEKLRTELYIPVKQAD